MEPISGTLQIMVGGKIPIRIGTVSLVELQEMLGSGGFGSAWKVQDCVTKKDYVLKIIQGIKPDSSMAKRVRLEAEVSIPSEHIVKVIGFREWNPSTYLILFDYIPGKSLDKVLLSGKINNEQKLRIFKDVLTGVADAHQNNVIHRDLKPENILVLDKGGAKIIDFGISKFKGSGVTVSGEILGTIPYMAPELIVISAKVADARADIFSLGHILYELATGQHYWERQGWTQLSDLINYLRRVPTPTEVIDCRDFRCDFFPEAVRILPQMVKIDPEDRLGNVDEILAELGCIRSLPTPPGDLHLRYPLLIIESGSNRGGRTVLNIADGEARTLGRYDLAGSDNSISRQHLRFHRSGNKYFVQHVGSRPDGTMMRGLVLGASDPPCEIKHTDRIKVGDVFLRFAFLRDT